MILAAPAALWLLPVVLVLAWYLVRFRRGAEPALGYSRVDDLRDLEPAGVRLWLGARPWLRAGALGCLVLALARPQQGLRSDETFGPMTLADAEMLGVESIGDATYSVKFAIRTLPLKRWDVRREMLRRLKERIQKLQIKITIPA